MTVPSGVHDIAVDLFVAEAIHKEALAIQDSTVPEGSEPRNDTHNGTIDHIKNVVKGVDKLLAAS